LQDASIFAFIPVDDNFYIVVESADQASHIDNELMLWAIDTDNAVNIAIMTCLFLIAGSSVYLYRSIRVRRVDYYPVIVVDAMHKFPPAIRDVFLGFFCFPTEKIT
jgi:hypothetical protein